MAEWMQNSSGGMFIQWRCDLHTDEERGTGCTEVADDPGYCPSGCTYMMVTDKIELKWQVEDPAQNYTCLCDNDCEHSIKPADFYQLEVGLVVNALWPFDDNHYYPARIVYITPTLWFPDEAERAKMAQVEFKKKKGLWQIIGSNKKVTLKELGENVYCAYDAKNCEVWINRSAQLAKKSKEAIEKSKLTDDDIHELAKLNSKLRWLEQSIDAQKRK